MDDLDQPMDDEDRALQYITLRATRFKMGVLVPCLVLGTAASFVCAVAAGLRWGKVGMLLAFSAPFLGALLVCSVLLKLTLPRLVARWLIEASAKFQVSRRSLVGLVRNTVLSVPTVDPVEWATAAAKAKTSHMGLMAPGGTPGPVAGPRRRKR